MDQNSHRNNITAIFTVSFSTKKHFAWTTNQYPKKLCSINTNKTPIKPLRNFHGVIISRAVTKLLFDASFGFYAVGLFHSVVAFVSKRNLFYKVATASVGVGFVFHSLFIIYSGLEGSHFPLTDLKESLTFFAWTVSLCFFISYFTVF